MEPGEETKKEREARRTDINLDCRFYENKFPNEGDYVKVKVREVVDNGAYVSLLEYNNIEGMITTSEFTTARLKNITKVIKEGKQETVIVLRVDKDKGYIDLSKKKVNAEEMKEFEDQYGKAKTVHTILRTVADKVNLDLEKIYQCSGWPLHTKFGNCYDAFKISLIEPEKVWTGLTIPENIFKALTAEIRRRLAPNEVKIRADFEMTCYTYEGIEAIKKALRAGEKHSTEDIQLKFQVISAPVYVVVSNTMEKTLGIEVVNKSLVDVEATIKSLGGSYKLKEAAKIVGDKGDQDIKDLMKAIDQKQDSDEEDQDEDEAMDVDIEGANEEQKLEEDDDDDA
eukprot:CAMPEP_0176424388 /NCGR_PEP_ID=MMETSP0127-20121128/10811_1 /TAXON_ID=938130 /ORGANISM="Platyophrya macrostoma, Strain WH" /LENGTH=340 /DNA_ID=CAMNT_0017805443 /DNA_START=45 /DNA_END=1067 /DNA_ORIENTATION=+